MPHSEEREMWHAVPGCRPSSPLYRSHAVFVLASHFNYANCGTYCFTATEYESSIAGKAREEYLCWVIVLIDNDISRL